MTKETTGGRPVSPQASVDLKAAALRLIRENGYENVSIAAIAKAAGVARQTLYNRWNTKADLVLEAVFEETQNYAAEPVLDGSQDSHVLLEAFLTQVFEHLRLDGDTLRALIASAQSDEAFQDAFHGAFVVPREKMITSLLHHAQSRGEIARNRDPEMMSTLIHGAFWYRLLNRRPLDPAFARDLTAEAFS